MPKLSYWLTLTLLLAFTVFPSANLAQHRVHGRKPAPKNQKPGPLDPLSLSWLENQIKPGDRKRIELGDQELIDADVVLFNLLCRRGGGIEPKKKDIERLGEKGAGPKVLAFLNHRLERQTDKTAVNPCIVTNIVLADFYNEDNTSSAAHDPNVTSQIRFQLQNLTREFSDLKFISLNAPIREQEGHDGAVKIGKQYKASVVIRGMYTRRPNETKISARVDTLNFDLPVNSTLELSGPADGLDNVNMEVEMGQGLQTMLLLTMGIIRQNALDPEAAKGYFERVIERVRSQPILPREIAFQAHLSRVSLRWKTTTLYNGSEWKEMIKELEDAVLDLNSTSSAAHLQLLRLYSKIDSEKAIKNGKAAVQLAKSNKEKIDAHMGLAYFYQGIKDPDGLRENAEAAITLLGMQNETIEGAMSRVNAYRLLGHKEADDQIRKAIGLIEKDPHIDAFDYLRKGSLEFYLGKHSAMETSLIKALEIKPNLIDANISLCIYYLDLEDFEKKPGRSSKDSERHLKALDFATKAIHSAPTLPDGYWFRALVYRSMGNIEKSVEDYKRVLLLNPGYSATHLAISNLYADQKDYETAIRYMDSLIKKSRDPLFLNERGKYYLAEHKTDLAQADFSECDGLLKNEIFKAEKEPGENLVDRYRFDNQLDIFNDRIDLIRFLKEFETGVELCNRFLSTYGDYEPMNRKRDQIYAVKSALLHENSRIKPESQRPALLLEAEKALNQAIGLAPGVAKYYIRRVTLFLEQGKLDPALADADKLVRLEPENPKYYLIRSTVQSKIHNLDAWIKDLETAYDYEKNEKEKENIKKIIDEAKAHKAEDDELDRQMKRLQ